METTFFNLTKPKQYIQNCTDLFRLPRAFDTFNIVIIHIDTRIFTYGANSNEKMDNRVTITFRKQLIGAYSLNYCLRRYTAQQQQQQRGSRGFPGQPGSRGFRTGAPNWSFIFDPAGRLCYYWSMVVSLAFLYNFWVIIYRFAFQEING